MTEQVEAENSPPIARDDRFTGAMDWPKRGNVFVDNGTGADRDPDGDAFEVQNPGQITPHGLGGTVELMANGNMVYTPPEGLLGTATFDYTIVDAAGNTDSATVTIQIFH